jgi:hypothetical protein
MRKISLETHSTSEKRAREMLSEIVNEAENATVPNTSSIRKVRPAKRRKNAGRSAPPPLRRTVDGRSVIPPTDPDDSSNLPPLSTQASNLMSEVPIPQFRSTPPPNISLSAQEHAAVFLTATSSREERRQLREDELLELAKRNNVLLEELVQLAQEQNELLRQQNERQEV